MKMGSLPYRPRIVSRSLALTAVSYRWMTSRIAAPARASGRALATALAVGDACPVLVAHPEITAHDATQVATAIRAKFSAFMWRFSLAQRLTPSARKSLRFPHLTR